MGNTAQRKVITYTRSRMIGHNLIDKLFRDVPSGERMEPTDPERYPWPFANTLELMLDQDSAQGA